MANGPSALSNIHMVLVRPETPGNVGAAARIIHNFGLGELRIVEDRPDTAGVSINHQSEARMFAHRSLDILESARRFPDLVSALEGCHWTVALSRRLGRKREQSRPIRSHISQVILNAEGAPGAAIFGPESDGLSLNDLTHCDITMHIPQRSPGPSLNLAQAVAVFGSEAFQNALVPGSLSPPEHPRTDDVERVVRRSARLARYCGLTVRNRPEETIEDLRRVLLHSDICPHDLAVVERWIAQIEWFVGINSKRG